MTHMRILATLLALGTISYPGAAQTQDSGHVLVTVSLTAGGSPLGGARVRVVGSDRSCREGTTGPGNKVLTLEGGEPLSLSHGLVEFLLDAGVTYTFEATAEGMAPFTGFTRTLDAGWERALLGVRMKPANTLRSLLGRWVRVFPGGGEVRRVRTRWIDRDTGLTISSLSVAYHQNTDSTRTDTLTGPDGWTPWIELPSGSAYQAIASGQGYQTTKEFQLVRDDRGDKMIRFEIRKVASAYLPD